MDQLDKLKTALRELEGFARRNDERAAKAMRAHATAENEVRYHEAHRIYLVIQARVQEALA